MTSLFFTLEVRAEKSIFNSPYVGFAPDGKAWTTNAGDRDIRWYPNGTTVHTGAISKLPPLQEGEHYYKVFKEGTISIGEWRVEWAYGQCVHSDYPEEFHGIEFGRRICGAKHYSGWIAYCADCRQPLNRAFVYMSKEAAESIDCIPTSLDYYYTCPECQNLEQGSPMSHKCLEPSANRYCVRYMPNWPDGKNGSGVMDISVHMFDDVPKYEGKTVIPVKKLLKNTYDCKGYCFVGWNTEPDGTGINYSDEAVIRNLTTENWEDPMGETGVVTLYAKWKPSESRLVIDPNGGSYMGSEKSVEILGRAGTSYTPDVEQLKPANGHRVSFVANGGDEVASITNTAHLADWKLLQPSQGDFISGVYRFPLEDACLDVLQAEYEDDEMTLPIAKREGYTFGGWYYDTDLSIPAGNAIRPSEDIVLYAQWVDLSLTATDNYKANHGAGAVDLSWRDDFKGDFVYKVYQMECGKEWVLVDEEEHKAGQQQVDFKDAIPGTDKQYVVPANGMYHILLSGAQGGDYGNHSGGKGGVTEADLWLQKGEVLTYDIGGKDGTGGGGTGTVFANGGGCSKLISNKQGILLVAGGGGSATENGDGGDGGNESSVTDCQFQGENGQAGGGAGYYGGKSGEWILHEHDKAVCGFHTHTGDSIHGGACYQKKVPHKHSSSCSWRYAYYCGGDDGLGHKGWCPNCGMNESGGCPGTYGYNACVRYVIYTCNDAPTYQLTCQFQTGYHCGMNEGDVVSSKPAYGGSNYISREHTYNGSNRAGEKYGNGELVITSLQIGYTAMHNLEVVDAPDRNPPEKVERQGVHLYPCDNEMYVLSWEAPTENGTVYYHRVESFEWKNSTVYCTSNVTHNELVSGIRGYYIVLDNEEETVVDESAMFLAESSLRLKRGENHKFLHIAAVDRAGNIGDTAHIQVMEEEVCWNILTKALAVEDSDGVFYKAPGEWYVRGDGSTPIHIRYGAVMDGVPNTFYQLNYANIKMSVTQDNDDYHIGETVGKHILYVPMAESPTENVTVDNSELRYQTEGKLSLIRFPYLEVKRESEGKELNVIQSFWIAKENHGKHIVLIPEAGAINKSTTLESIQYSSATLDAKNRICLIVDSEGPVVEGQELLRQLQVSDNFGQSFHISLCAHDSISGLNSFNVTVRNSDNNCQEVYTAENGELSFDVNKQEPLYAGDVEILIYAVDNVGNETVETIRFTEFALVTEVVKLRQNTGECFKKGESGCIRIHTWGYADRIEVAFPEGIHGDDGSQMKVIDYSNNRIYEHSEEILFRIALDSTENEEYRIVVTAYKGDKRLDEFPSIGVVSVAGNVLDEVRTRLR